jgi:transposase
VVARRHDINANMLFTWRRMLASQRNPGNDPPPFVPAVVSAGAPARPPAAEDRDRGAHDADDAMWPVGRMEIVLASGCRVIVDKDVNAAALARVIGVLERR